jgi:hypothetical protein
MLRRPIILHALLACALLAAALCLWGAFGALTAKPIRWISVAFELTGLLGAFMLVLLARGRIRQGPAITCLCVAGAVGAGALLAYVSAGRPVAEVKAHAPTLIRLAIAGALVAIAALDVLLRAPKATLPRFGIGLALGAPLLIIIALLQRGTIARAFAPLGSGLEFGAYILLTMLVIGLVAASGHYLITAFQIGVAAFKDEAPSPATLPPSPPAPPATPAPAPSGAPAAQA